MKKARLTVVASDPAVQALWNSVCKNAQEEKAKWINNLRLQGIRAAHPNDGWVDRSLNRVSFAYPHFNDGVRPGDFVMLGWPPIDAGEPPSNERLVYITSIEESQLGLIWHYFIDVDVDKPKKPWWKFWS
jgi:hypothetical protein